MSRRKYFLRLIFTSKHTDEALYTRVCLYSLLCGQRICLSIPAFCYQYTFTTI